MLFKGSKTGSYLTIESKEGSRVPVAAWEVSAEDRIGTGSAMKAFPLLLQKRADASDQGNPKRENPNAEYFRVHHARGQTLWGTEQFLYANVSKRI